MHRELFDYPATRFVRYPLPITVVSLCGFLASLPRVHDGLVLAATLAGLCILASLPSLISELRSPRSFEVREDTLIIRWGDSQAAVPRTDVEPLPMNLGDFFIQTSIRVRAGRHEFRVFPSLRRFELFKRWLRLSEEDLGPKSRARTDVPAPHAIVPDIIARVQLFTHAEGGREGPTRDDFLACIFAIDDHAYDCRLLLHDTGRMAPGGGAVVPIKFLRWDLASAAVRPGARFLLRDNRTIGEGEVLGVHGEEWTAALP